MLSEVAAQLEPSLGLTRPQTEKIQRALRGTLAQAMGDDLANAPDGARHPFTRLLINSAPWARLELLRLADAIELTSSTLGVARLREQLRSASRFAEAATLISLAAGFSRAGFDPEFEAPLSNGERIKHPDLLLHDSFGVPAFAIELKQLGATFEQKRIDACSFEIFVALSRAPQSATWCGVIHRLPSTQRLGHIARMIDDAISRLKVSGFEIVTIERVITIALSGSPEDERLIRFSREAKVQPGTILGPPQLGSERRRVLSALKSKRHQCADSVPTIIAIQCAALEMVRGSWHELAADIQEELGEVADVTGAAVLTEHLGPLPAVTSSWESAVYSRRIRHDVLSEHLLVVRNPFPRMHLSEDMWERIRQSLLLATQLGATPVH